VLQRENSLIDQSLHSREGATTTNGDGFGIGWYDELGGVPALYKSVHPAWNDRNLRELAAHVRSPLFFAHIRASTGTAVQETNTHPFRYGRWLFMHNGLVRNFAEASASSRRARTNCTSSSPADPEMEHRPSASGLLQPRADLPEPALSASSRSRLAAGHKSCMS
jgi:predicted glutamine amidotransferase